MKIYTKSGDKGKTSLFGGTRINKDHIQIEAYGTVDELNSFLGLLISYTETEFTAPLLKRTQSILFDIGSHLASDGKADDYLPELDTSQIDKLEQQIDEMTDQLPALKSFIMPGGNQRIASAHLCRTICRRAERRVVSLSEVKEITPFIITYLNRLSDYFFVMARFLAYRDGIDEVKWNPK